MTPRSILVCTVGTSLLGNLKVVKPADDAALADAFACKDWTAVAEALASRQPTERVCGAEINSTASMLQRGHVAAGCGLYFLHSDTDDGRNIATVLVRYFQQRGHAPVRPIQIDQLQDTRPRDFRTHGLRNLVRQLCGVLRDHGPSACAINATGGYKAQIAVAVLLGQALGVPVYYKHELFDEVIAFPPLPVAWDLDVWMRASGLLFDLDRSRDVVPADQYADDWDERYESLVERETVDGVEYLGLSPAGQIFHETFRERFRQRRADLLPPPVKAAEKKPPKCDHGHLPGLQGLEPFLVRLINEVPQVVTSRTHYHNPDLPQRNRFRLSSDGIEGIWSDGSQTVKFLVETRAADRLQMEAMVALLNEWLAG